MEPMELSIYLTKTTTKFKQDRQADTLVTSS